MADRLFADLKLSALYDALCPRMHRLDFDFYMPMVLSARSVLDVGCGTGSLLKEARRLGHRGRLCGLDPAPGMLFHARAAQDIEWVLGDPTSVKLTGKFDFVVMTGHAFQVLLTDEQVRETFAAVGSMLSDGGRFAFETRNPLAREWECWSEAFKEVADEHGRAVRMTRRIEAPFANSRLSFSHTFVSDGWDEQEISHSTLRFLGVEDLNALLSQEGLEVKEQYGDWDRSPVSECSPEVITVAARRLTLV